MYFLDQVVDWNEKREEIENGRELGIQETRRSARKRT